MHFIIYKCKMIHVNCHNIGTHLEDDCSRTAKVSTRLRQVDSMSVYVVDIRLRHDDHIA